MAERSAFKFNLLPPKSDQEVALENESSNSLFYAVVLVLFSVVVFVIILALQYFITAPNLRRSETAVLTREGQLRAFDNVKFNFGQLVVKLNAMQPLLDKQLNPDDIFATADTIRLQDPSIIVTGYGRLPDGRFTFQIVTSRPEELPQLIRDLEANDKLEDVILPSIDFDLRAGTAQTVISLIIKEVTNATSTN